MKYITIDESKEIANKLLSRVNKYLKSKYGINDKVKYKVDPYANPDIANMDDKILGDEVVIRFNNRVFKRSILTKELFESILIHEVSHYVHNLLHGRNNKEEHNKNFYEIQKEICRDLGIKFFYVPKTLSEVKLESLDFSSRLRNCLLNLQS